MTSNNIVSFLGPEASYTHQAALKAFRAPKLTTKYHPSSSTTYQCPHTFTPLTGIPEVFSSVQSHQAAYGVIPIENSTNGAVLETAKCLAYAGSRYPQVAIVGEVRLPIRHALLGPRRRPRRGDGAANSGIKGVREEDNYAPPAFGVDALPDLRWIKRLHTHTQAWSQCSGFLAYLEGLPTSTGASDAAITKGNDTAAPKSSNEPHPKRIDAKSTSAAAAHIASLSSNSTTGDDDTDLSSIVDAAIASPAAASYHDLPILVRAIEDDHTGNVTRFLVLGCTSPSTSSTSFTPTSTSAQVIPNPPPRPPPYAAPTEKSLLTLTLDLPTRPGALSRALSVFSTHHLNLTNLTSVPSALRPWDYTWVVEVDLGVEDRKDYAGIGRGGERLERAVGVLAGEVVRDVRVLGRWWWSGEFDREGDE